MRLWLSRRKDGSNETVKGGLIYGGWRKVQGLCKNPPPPNEKGRIAPKMLTDSRVSKGAREGLLDYDSLPSR